jgi:hypothetical protein
VPRPNPGPRLVSIRKPGWSRSIFYIRWTERGQKRERATPFDASHSRDAQEYFETWLAERRRAARTGPGDPDQVKVTDLLTDYAREHGSEVAAPETLIGSIEPLRAFFTDDTLASLTTERIKEYWIWRRGHSIHGLNRERTRGRDRRTWRR